MSDTNAPAQDKPAAQSVSQQAEKVAADPAAVAAKTASQGLKNAIHDAFNPPSSQGDINKALAEADKAKAAPAPVSDVKPAPRPTSLLDRKAASDAPAPVATAEADLPESKLTIDDKAPEPQKKNFAAMRGIINSLREEIKAKAREEADFKKQLDTYKAASPADTAELQRLKDEHKSLSDRLAIVDLANHPDFAKQYVLPQKAAIKEAAEVLGYNGKEAADLTSLLSKSKKDFNAAVSELTKDMNHMDATTVQTAMRNAHQLHAAQAEALSKSGELSQTFQQQNAARAKADVETVWNNLSGETGMLMQIHAPENATPEQIKETEAYNQSAQEVRANYERNAFGRVDGKGAATFAAKAAILDHLMQHGIPRIDQGYKAMAAERDALRAEVASLKGAKKVGPVTGDPGTNAGVYAPKSIKDLVRSAWSGGQ